MQRMRTNLTSRLSGAIDTHSKLLEVREEAEARTKTFKLEDNLKVLKRPVSEPPAASEDEPEEEAAPEVRDEAESS